MPRCSTPDRLIGIGGGGSRVVYRFMQQDWILDEVMETDKYGQSEPDTLRATIIDSATNDKFHSEYAPVVEEKVKAAYEDTDKEPGDGYLKFEGPRLISGEVPSRWLGESLTAPPSVRNLCADQDLTSWWLKEGREPLSKVNETGFGGGVLRRRSVSKLLHHVAGYTDNSAVPSGIGEDQVYIVVSLGGGTGSGMALDLASELQDGDTQIHLFGVLPHDSAGGLEKTNAHAALSELEYAHLTGEGPFQTITLIPHLEVLEDQDRDFEMGVVRSILAHANGIDSDNLTTYITPETDISTNPPKYTPFTVAAPYTIKYDLKTRELAEEAVDEMLSEKEDETRRESDLYEVIETYFREAFPDTAGAQFDGARSGTLDTEWGREAAYTLRQRIEDDIRGTLLEQPALELADLGDLVDEIKETIDETPKVAPPDEDGETREGVNPLEAAVDFVDDVPGIIHNRLAESPEYDDIGPDDELRYDLLDVLKQEMRNIEKRQEIWKATSLITPEDPDLEKGEAEVVRTAIREVIMDHDTELLIEQFQDPSLDDMVDDWQGQREALESTVTELSDFYETLFQNLQMRSNTWNDSAYGDAKALAAINDHEEQVGDAIADLINEVETAVKRVEDASTEDGVDSVSLQGVGPLDEMEIEGVAPLNDKLEEIGVAEIDLENLRHGFEFVKDAKRNKINHGGGLPIIGGGKDLSEQFDTNATTVRETGWFEINPTSPDPSIEEAFSVRFKNDKLRRESEVETRRDELIDSIADDFEEAFTEGGSFVEHSLRYTTAGRGSNTKTLSLPQRLDRGGLRTSIERDLRDSSENEPDKLLKNALPFEAVDRDDPESALGSLNAGTTRRLVEAYLRPIAEELGDASDQLEKLTGGSDGERHGLIQRFELLRGLSSGRIDRADIDPPQANEFDRRPETYGRDFARNYEGRYEIELEESAEPSDTQDHPYLEHKKADQELIAGAHDIADSDILEQDEGRIIQDLENSVRRLLNNEHGRAPINNLRPMAKGEEVEPNFGGLRVVPIYMSRGFEENPEKNRHYEAVREKFEEKIEIANNSMYKVGTHEAGDRDEITMVTFIGGLFLDNIGHVSKGDGYMDLYEGSSQSGFIASHHTIGVGGNWNRWSTMYEWAVDSGKTYDENDFGAYVYRDTVRDVDEEFLSEVMIADTSEEEDPRDIFLNMLEVGTYESSFPLTDRAIEATDD